MPPSQSNFLHFHAVLAKFGYIIGWHPFEVGASWPASHFLDHRPLFLPAGCSEIRDFDKSKIQILISVADLGFAKQGVPTPKMGVLAYYFGQIFLENKNAPTCWPIEGEGSFTGIPFTEPPSLHPPANNGTPSGWHPSAKDTHLLTTAPSYSGQLPLLRSAPPVKDGTPC